MVQADLELCSSSGSLSSAVVRARPGVVGVFLPSDSSENVVH